MHSMVELMPASELVGAAWRAKAACLEQDPDLFFPDGKSSPLVLEQIAEAKLVCAECPVRARCLQEALDTDEESGVWGGWSEDERRALKRAARRAARRVA